MIPDSLNALCAARPIPPSDWVLLGLWCLVFGWALWILWRNTQVHRFRMAILTQMAKTDDPTIWLTWCKAFDAVSYEAMLYRPWRPLRSFYAGTILDSDQLLP